MQREEQGWVEFTISSACFPLSVLSETDRLRQVRISRWFWEIPVVKQSHSLRLLKRHSSASRVHERVSTPNRAEDVIEVYRGIRRFFRIVNGRFSAG